ncbi:MAG: phosphatase PAP2 family protein [Verrucomicrobia bacterium]|nr:phosphatase PAP2 family protein [Verrucomicrobiota bacterium]
MKNYTFVDYATQGYLALVGLLILCFHNHTVPNWPRLLGAHAVGLVLVHGLIQVYARHKSFKLLDLLRHFYPVLLYGAFFVETGSLNRMFFLEYLDPLVAQWEQQLFGCQPSVLFMQKLPWLAVSEIFYISYFSYYIMIGGVGIALFLRNREQFFHYVSVVSFLFYVCYLIYIILPVIGSRAFFHQVEGYTLPAATQQLAVTDAYPEAVQMGLFFRLMRWVYVVFEAPGAALPSSHVAVALCTVSFSFRYLRPIRYLHLAVAVLLCLATVYCRYHYVVDVLAGLVTAAVLIPLGNWLYRRSQE